MLGENSAALRTNDAARHADQLLDTDRAVAVFRHVDAHHLLFVAKHELGDRLGQLGLADAGWSKEQEHTVGFVMRLFQWSFVQPQTLRDCLDCSLLTNYATAQHRFDHRKSIARVAEDHVARNTRLLRDDFDDVLRLDDHFLRFVDLDLNRGRIEPADRLVGKMEIANVFWRHLESHVDGVVRDLDGVVLFQTRTQTEQNLARFGYRRLDDFDEPETARECFVFSDVFFVLGKSGRADNAHFATRQRRLKHVGGIGGRAQRSTCADDRVCFVNEEDQVVAFLDFVDDALDPFFKHAAQHGAGDDAAHL